MCHFEETHVHIAAERDACAEGDWHLQMMPGQGSPYSSSSCPSSSLEHQTRRRLSTTSTSSSYSWTSESSNWPATGAAMGRYDSGPVVASCDGAVADDGESRDASEWLGWCWELLCATSTSTQRLSSHLAGQHEAGLQPPAALLGLVTQAWLSSVWTLGGRASLPAAATPTTSPVCLALRDLQLDQSPSRSAGVPVVKKKYVCPRTGMYQGELFPAT